MLKLYFNKLFEIDKKLSIKSSQLFSSSRHENYLPSFFYFNNTINKSRLFKLIPHKLKYIEFNNPFSKITCN